MGRRVGLANRGQTCFLNSALQCLSHVPELSNRLLKQPYEGDCAVTREYAKLVRTMWSKDRPKVIDPASFHEAFVKKFPRFANQEPHDVQEVVLELIDTFEKSLGVGFVQSVFNGTETQEVTYPGGTSKKDSDVTLIVVHPTRQGQSLEELMQQRGSYHAFSGYVDDMGQEYHAAVTRTLLTKMPLTLIVSFGQYDKKYSVKVPHKFEGYILFGLVMHIGSTAGGHYLSFVKHKGVWCCADDDTVVDREPPETGQYYLAFYKKSLQKVT